jgi:hypothetical protein
MITKTELLDQNKKLLETIETRQRKLAKMSAKLHLPGNEEYQVINNTLNNEDKHKTAFKEIINLLKFQKEEEIQEEEFVYLNKAL